MVWLLRQRKVQHVCWSKGGYDIVAAAMEGMIWLLEQLRVTTVLEQSRVGM